MKRSTTLICASVVLATPALALAGAAGGSNPEQESSEGQRLYAAHCVQCHGASLGGTDIAPPLAGDYFRSQWGSAPIGELRSKIALTMPPDVPGTLSASQYDAILKFILHQNGQKTPEDQVSSD